MFLLNQHRVSMRFSVNMVRISIVVSVLQSSEGLVLNLVHQAQRSVVCSFHHTAATPPTVPVSRHCGVRRTPPLACPHRRAVHEGLLHAVSDRLPETKHALHCMHASDVNKTFSRPRPRLLSQD